MISRSARLGVGLLDRTNGHCDDVIDLNGFLDDEGLAVFHADLVAVEAGDGAEAVADFVLRREEAGAVGRFSVLRGVTEESGHAALELRADIDDE